MIISHAKVMHSFKVWGGGGGGEITVLVKYFLVVTFKVSLILLTLIGLLFTICLKLFSEQ